LDIIIIEFDQIDLETTVCGTNGSDPRPPRVDTTAEQ